MSSILCQISYTQRRISVAKRRCLLCRVQGCMTFRMTPRYRFRHWSCALRSAILPLAQRPPQFSFFNIGSKSKIRQHPGTHASIVGLLRYLCYPTHFQRNWLVYVKLWRCCGVIPRFWASLACQSASLHRMVSFNVPCTKPACISAVAPSHPWRCPELDFDPRALC